MRYRIHVRIADRPKSGSWPQEIKQAPEVVDQATAEEAAEVWVERYNTEKREYDHALKIVDVEFLGNYLDHDWKRTNPERLIDKDGNKYDEYVCTRCRVTGKRYFLCSIFVRDKPNHTKMYKDCNWRLKKSNTPVPMVLKKMTGRKKVRRRKKVT